MKGNENFKKVAALSLAITFGMMPATGVIAESTMNANTEVTSFASVSDGFIIENGTLTKYNGTEVDVIIPSTVSKIGN